MIRRLLSLKGDLPGIGDGVGQKLVIAKIFILDQQEFIFGHFRLSTLFFYFFLKRSNSMKQNGCKPIKMFFDIKVFTRAFYCACVYLNHTIFQIEI